MMPRRLLVEPCHPYDLGPARDDPVDVWAIIDRLDEFQLRGMAMALAIHNPEIFETRLMERR